MSRKEDTTNEDDLETASVQPKMETEDHKSKAKTEAKTEVDKTEQTVEPTEQPTESPGQSKQPADTKEQSEQVNPVTTSDEPGLLPSQHWTQMPESDQDGNDSAFDEDPSSTASLSSSILEYRSLNGRRYHSDRGNAQYWVSNDEQSNEALDINHHVITLMYGGKLHKAPLKSDIQAVVDVGTGTGIWAIDFADEYPNAKVIGTDISPIQPRWIPPNLEFQIDDCTQEWTFEDNSLDYIHLRFLVGSIADWPALFEQAYRCLKPGGYVESHEGSPSIGSDDNTVDPSSAMGQWGKIFLEGGRKLGRPFSILEDNTQRKGMEEAGFVDVEESDIKVPIGGWPEDEKLKEAGRYFQAAILQDIEGTLMFIAHLNGWPQEQMTVFEARYRKEIKSKQIHGHFSQRVVWARKPEVSER